jgi:hypothetical protein
MYNVANTKKRRVVNADDDNQAQEAQHPEEREQWVPCAQHQNYAHRGHMLRHLNLMEAKSNGFPWPPACWRLVYFCFGALFVAGALFC